MKLPPVDQFSTKLQPLLVPSRLNDWQVFFAQVPFWGIRPRLRRRYRRQMLLRNECPLGTLSCYDQNMVKVLDEIQQVLIRYSGYTKLILIPEDEIAAVDILIDYSGTIMVDCFIALEDRFGVDFDVQEWTFIGDIAKQVSCRGREK